ncbi:MAG: YaeQ family protein [Polyangiales bacterium]
MALPSTVYRLEIAVQDTERGVYEDLSLRVAQHPSETERFLVTRILAYCLSYEPELAFTKGLSTTDEPAIWSKDATGATTLWIDVGQPSIDRLHRASKLAGRVEVYTHRDPEVLRKEAEKQRVHKGESIRLVAFDPAFLDRVAAKLERSSKWEVLRTEGHVYVTIGGETIDAPIRETTLVDA